MTSSILIVSDLMVVVFQAVSDHCDPDGLDYDYKTERQECRNKNNRERELSSLFYKKEQRLLPIGAWISHHFRRRRPRRRSPRRLPSRRCPCCRPLHPAGLVIPAPVTPGIAGTTHSLAILGRHLICLAPLQLDHRDHYSTRLTLYSPFLHRAPCSAHSLLQNSPL
jgi:hypothetical protein